VRRQTRRGITNAPKTAAGRRELPLSRSVAQRLWTLHRGRSGEDPVFAHPATGERMEYHWAEHNILRPAREAGGLDWLTFHGLRHTCASLLFANGKNLKQVQHWLGHSSPQLTQNTYLHLMDDGLGGADFLDDLTARVSAGCQQTQPNSDELPKRQSRKSA
jgi:integrase